MDIMQIMNLTPFKDTTVLAGHIGIRNEVSSATFIDAPDGYDWCKEGDFIVTTGYPFVRHHREEGIMQLLEILVEKKCSGVGIKFGRYIPNITEKAIAFADQNKLPIISLPNQLSWSDIIYPIVAHINKKQQSELENTHQVYEQFHQHLKNKGDLQDLTKLLHSFQEVPVTIFLRNFNQIINTDGAVIFKDEIENIISTLSIGKGQTLQRIKWRHKDITIRWIFNSNSLEGGIFLWGMESNLTTWRKAAIEQAAAIVALNIERLRAVSTTFQRFRNEFLSDLLSSKSIERDALFRRAKEMNWDLKNIYKVLLLDCLFMKQLEKTQISKWEQKNSLLEAMQNKLTPLFPEIILGLEKDNRVALLIPDYINTDQLLHELAKITSKIGVTRTVGGMGRLKSIDNLSISYKEAALSLRVAHTQHTNSGNPERKKRSNLFIKDFSALSIERIIFSKNPASEISHLVTEYLQKVIDYDNNRNSELMLTLRIYLNYNGNIHGTAEALIIHKNTVRYRIGLIEDLTNLDLKNLKDQLLLQMMLTGSDAIESPEISE